MRGLSRGLNYVSLSPFFRCGKCLMLFNRFLSLSLSLATYAPPQWINNTFLGWHMREWQNLRSLPHLTELLNKIPCMGGQRRCSCIGHVRTRIHIHTHIYIDRYICLSSLGRLFLLLSPSFSLSFSNFLHRLSCNPFAISRIYLVKVSARRRTLARR